MSEYRWRAAGWGGLGRINANCSECHGVGYVHTGEQKEFDTQSDKILFWTCCSAYDDHNTVGGSVTTYGCKKCSKNCKDRRDVLLKYEYEYWGIKK